MSTIIRSSTDIPPDAPPLGWVPTPPESVFADGHRAVWRWQQNWLSKQLGEKAYDVCHRYILQWVEVAYRGDPDEALTLLVLQQRLEDIYDLSPSADAPPADDES